MTKTKKEIEVPPSGMTFSRVLMPQIAGKDVPDFLDNLSDQGIGHVKTKHPPHELKATQSEFDHDKVRSLIGKTIAASPIIVSNDNYILDGHHRWLAKYNENKSKPIDTLRVNLPILELMKTAKDYERSFSKDIAESAIFAIKSLARKINS